MLHSLQNHLHVQSHLEEHLEEPSKIHLQIQNPFACCSVKYHLQDTEMAISSHAENNEIVYPMFRQLVWLYSYEKCTNVTKLNHIKENIWTEANIYMQQMQKELKNPKKYIFTCKRVYVVGVWVRERKRESKHVSKWIWYKIIASHHMVKKEITVILHYLLVNI